MPAASRRSTLGADAGSGRRSDDRDAGSAGAAARDGSKRCDVRQAPRTFIGFADGQTLDDFEATAIEAERLLATLGVVLCGLSEEQDAQGTLRAALAEGAVEITAVRFTLADLTTADVELRSATESGTDGGAEPRWLVRCERAGNAWRIVSALRL
jgi:hypothetical protein